MEDDRIVQCIADRLDGLLDGAQAEEADRLIEAHPALHAKALRLRAVLYAPWSVSPPRRRPALLRYAAAFAAGVLLTQLLQGRPEPPDPQPQPDPVLVVENRRIT